MSKTVGPGRLDSEKTTKPTMLLNVSTEMAISSPGLGSATSLTTAASSSSADSTDLDSPQKWFHPFAGSTGKLEILPSSANSDMIDVEEEARLYDELCRNYEEDSDSVSHKSLSVFRRYQLYNFGLLFYSLQNLSRKVDVPPPFTTL